MIEFKNVNLKYVDEFFSLLDFSYTFDKNTLIIGDELSGANSILRLIAKFDKDYSGSILLDSENIKNIKDKNLNIAFVSKDPYLFKYRNLEYNLGYGLKIRKVKKHEIKEKVNELLLKYNLTNLPSKIKNLNYSEQKIVTLLRAIIRKPKYLLIENFFENLDEKYIELSKQIINDASLNTIIIMCENSNLDYLNNFHIIKMSGGVKLD